MAEARPRLLELYCKAGGSGMGYHRAGFDVVGVDIEPQPNYPFPFVQGDALDPLAWPGGEFDVIHASPPCQRYMTGGLVNRNRPDLIGPTRELLQSWGVPWIIENVPGAPMRRDLVMCGSRFGLKVRRHRWFETWKPLVGLFSPCDHTQPVVGVYGHPHGEAGAWPGMLPGTLKSWSEAMGIDWMTAAELSQAIPPAYTECIGQMLKLVL